MGDWAPRLLSVAAVVAKLPLWEAGLATTIVRLFAAILAGLWGWVWRGHWIVPNVAQKTEPVFFVALNKVRHIVVSG